MYHQHYIKQPSNGLIEAENVDEKTFLEGLLS